MDTKRICPVCGKPLAPSAPEGLCPECLLKGGLGTGVDIGPDTGGKAPRFTPPKIEELAAKFPQLEILELIGQGGMGAVYKARQKQLDRVVALKILPPQGGAGDTAFAERFTREARALAKLNHPHIVTLYEFGQSDGLFYFLMEFVDGVNLRQLLGHSRISPREALAIVPQICEALQFAHDSGIVHRDIKPENILLDKKGQVKIADFGVAKMIAESLTEAAVKIAPAAGELTEVGSTLGTPQYMAPEQIKSSAEVDHRADIYSLGVVFYQMLTGELPSGKIEPPSSRMRGVQIDVRLDEVVLRALEKKPELRFQQASDVKTAVETIATTPMPAPAETPPGFTHYKDPKGNFELDVPEGWNTLPPDLKNSPAELLRFASNENGTHLLILFHGPSRYFSLKEASDWAQKQLAKAGFGNFVSAETTLGGIPARTLDFDRPKDDGTWSCRHYFVAERGTGYVLGFGTSDKAGMFETFDRMAKSFRFQPSGEEKLFKPYFPKTTNVATDESKSESSGQKAEPALHTEGYTVRIEPVNPPKAPHRFGPGSMSALLATTRVAMLDPIRRFTILRTIFIAGFAVAAIVNLEPIISLFWKSVPELANTIETGRLVNYFEVIRFYFRLSLMWIVPCIFMALAIFYPRRWAFVAGSVYAIYQFLFYPLGQEHSVFQLSFWGIVLLNIARVMTLVGFWAKPVEPTGAIKPANSRAALRFGLGTVFVFLAIIVCAMAILHSVQKASVNARSGAASRLNVLFHYRVFEADAGLVDQLIPAGERRNGMQPNVKSSFAQGQQTTTFSAGNFNMVTHDRETESQFARVSPAVVHNLLKSIAATPGLLADKTNLVYAFEWPRRGAGSPTTWTCSENNSNFVGSGSGTSFLAVRENNGGTEARIEGNLNYSVDTMIWGRGANPYGTTSRFLYEGPVPQTNALAFLVPFVRRDGSQHYLVTVFDFNGQTNEDVAQNGQTPASKGDDISQSSAPPVPKTIGMLRSTKIFAYNNMAIALTKSDIGFPLHEIVARFAGPPLSEEAWRDASGLIFGYCRTLAPSPYEEAGSEISVQSSDCLYAGPNECDLQFALPDDTDAKEAARQMLAVMSKPLPLCFGERIRLFQVGQHEAWLEVRQMRPPTGQLAFINTDLRYADNGPLAGLSPVPPTGTNPVNSAAVTIPPDTMVSITGTVYWTENSVTNSSSACIPGNEANLFSTTLTNDINQPGLYWLTWRPETSHSTNGFEVFIHDGRTARELHHYVSDQRMKFAWRADWSYPSSTIGPGQPTQVCLLIDDGLTHFSGNRPVPYGVFDITMTMQPLLGGHSRQVNPESAQAQTANSQGLEQVSTDPPSQTEPPATQNELSLAAFLQKFDSGQIVKATITYSIVSGGASTISGKYFETDANGNIVKQNGQPVEESFVVPNVVLTPALETKLLPAKNISIDIPNPILSDIGYQLLFFVICGIALFSFIVLIIYSKSGRRFGPAIVIAILAVIVAGIVLSILHSFLVTRHLARPKDAAQENVLFHYRVFEADAGLVDQLIPSGERRNGVQPNVKSVYHPPQPLSESQFAPVSPAVIHSLLDAIVAAPGLLVDKTRLVSVHAWQPNLSENWVYGVNGGGWGNIFLGVRKENGATQVRIDGWVNHTIDNGTSTDYAVAGSGVHLSLNSRILYQGPLPQTNELAFLVPFVRHDGTQHNLVIVFDFNGENNEETPDLALSGPPFTAQSHQATVELACVGDGPWTNPICWYPNGQPSPKAFPTGESEIDCWAADCVMKKLVFYVHNESTNGLSAPIAHISDTSSAGISGSMWNPPYRHMPNGQFGLILGCPSNVMSANLSIGMANGPWETVVSMDHPSWAPIGQGNSEDNNWSGKYDSVQGKNGDVAVSCTYTTRSNWVSRIVYVNGNGDIVPIHETSASDDSQNSATGTLLVSSNEFAHIKQFLVQRRKFQWVDFENISLRQSYPTSVTAKVY